MESMLRSHVLFQAELKSMLVATPKQPVNDRKQAIDIGSYSCSIRVSSWIVLSQRPRTIHEVTRRNTKFITTFIDSRSKARDVVSHPKQLSTKVEIPPTAVGGCV